MLYFCLLRYCYTIISNCVAIKFKKMIVIAKMLLIQQSVSTTSALGEGRGTLGLILTTIILICMNVDFQLKLK